MCVKTKFPGPDPAPGRGRVSQKKMKKLTLLYVFHNIATACGGIVTSLNSVIQSPSYPSHYPNGVMCVWTIKIGQAFQLEYDAFNTEQSYDFLKAYNSLQSFSSTYQWRYHINTLIYVFIPNSERRQHVGRTMLGDTVHPRLSEPRLSEHQTWSQAEHNSIHFSEDIN